MEKISATPLSHNNNKKLTEISSTTTTKSIMLNLEFDSMPKLAESSVRDDVSLRTHFKRSSTCGSLFANCNCSHHSNPTIPLITETDCDKAKPKLDRFGRKNQSFSHPDTPVIFTEENRYPISTQLDSPNRLRTSQETIFKNGNQNVEIKHSKRSSSPNLGEFTISKVEIHPEFEVQVIPKSKSSAPLDTPRRRAILKKGSKSFPSTTRSFQRSDYSVDEESEETELSEKVSDLIVTDLDASSTSLSSQSTTTVVEVYQEKIDEKLSLQSPKRLGTGTAEKFFQVCCRVFLLRLRRYFNCSRNLKGVRNTWPDGERFEHLEEIV